MKVIGGGGSATTNTPAGTIASFGGGSAPTGWLLCDGSAVSRTTYAALFAVIGTTFGTGDGSTTFNVPDLRDRSPMGANSTVALGAAAGAATHTLSTSEIPSHTHPTYFTSNGSGSDLIASSSGSAPATFNTGATGGGGAHNNLHPVRGVHFIVKT